MDLDIALHLPRNLTWMDFNPFFPPTAKDVDVFMHSNIIMKVASLVGNEGG